MIKVHSSMTETRKQLAAASNPSCLVRALTEVNLILTPVFSKIRRRILVDGRSSRSGPKGLGIRDGWRTGTCPKPVSWTGRKKPEKTSWRNPPATAPIVGPAAWRIAGSREASRAISSSNTSGSGGWNRRGSGSGKGIPSSCRIGSGSRTKGPGRSAKRSVTSGGPPSAGVGIGAPTLALTSNPRS